MKINRKRKPLHWREEVGDLLKRTEIPRLRIAEEVGITPPMVTYYLSGRSNPSRERAIEINAAIGKLCGRTFGEGAARCLDAIFILEQAALGESTLTAAEEDDFLWVLRASFAHVAGYFVKDELQRRVRALTKEWQRSDLLAFFSDLVSVRWKRVVRYIYGREAELPKLEQFLRVCEDHGLDFSSALRPASEISLLLKQDAFHNQVENALYQLSIADTTTRFRSIQSRNHAAWKIYEAHSAVIDQLRAAEKSEK